MPWDIEIIGVLCVRFRSWDNYFFRTVAPVEFSIIHTARNVDWFASWYTIR